MKRIWIVALALALVAGVAAFALADEDEYNGGPGWGMMGPGMMGGGWGMMGGPGMMGPGMMGGGGMMGGWGMMGPGMMGGWGWGPGADLTREQADQLEKIQYDTMRAMRSMMYDNHDKMIAMQEAMRQFPIDQKAAQAQWEAMNATRQAMFALHLNAVAQAQKVLGKEKWEEMNQGWGPGRGRMGGGPGMMRNR